MEITLPTGPVEDFAEKFLGLTVSESTQASMINSLNLVSKLDSSSGSDLGFLEMNRVLFQMDPRTQHQLFKRSI
jgi:hypothetical protein